VPGITQKGREKQKTAPAANVWLRVTTTVRDDKIKDTAFEAFNDKPINKEGWRPQPYKGCDCCGLIVRLINLEIK
jgi:hypothetical protein